MCCISRTQDLLYLDPDQAVYRKLSLYAGLNYFFSQATLEVCMGGVHVCVLVHGRVCACLPMSICSMTHSGNYFKGAVSAVSAPMHMGNDTSVFLYAQAAARFSSSLPEALTLYSQGFKKKDMENFKSVLKRYTFIKYVKKLLGLSQSVFFIISLSVPETTASLFL